MKEIRGTDEHKFHHDALERFDDAQNVDFENRRQMLDDLEFAAGEQWPEELRIEREEANRPCLIVNLTSQFIRKVTGDIRQTNPGVDVIPGDEDASEDGADMYSGMIRNIEYESDATDAYERAAESAAQCSIGHFRVVVAQDDRGQMKLEIQGIPNPFAVLWDPQAKDPTRKDANYCFVIQEMHQDDFEAEYPDAEVVDWSSDALRGWLEHWESGEYVTVAEYFWKENGKVMWALLSGNKVLEKPREIPSKYIPVFSVVGEEIHIGERTVRNSVIRFAKDPQRVYNLMRSAEMEIVALQPKAPYIVTDREVEGLEDEWESANVRNYPYLRFNPDERIGGRPQRMAPPMFSAGMAQQAQQAAEDMKAATGIYEAALGAQGNEKSGVAIARRQLESDISTSIYVDNLSKTIKQCGRVLVDMIPRVYDTTRSVRLVAQDGSTRLEQINIPMRSPAGTIYLNDPSVGTYDVRVRTGPSYSTRRQEMVDGLGQLFGQLPPEQSSLLTDLFVRGQDWPDADVMADRIKKTLPPQILAEEEQEPPSPQQMQMMEMQRQLQEVQRQLGIRQAQADVAKAEAQASEAASDARGAQIEVAGKQLELALQSGQLNEAIQRLVNDAVARALMARTPPGMIPIN